VHGHFSRPQKDVDLRRRFPDFHFLANESIRDGIVVGVEIDVPFEVDGPVMNSVYLGNVCGKGDQEGLLGSEQVDGASVEVSLVGFVVSTTELQDLTVQVGEVLERTLHQEVIFYIMERSLDLARAVLVQDPMCHKPEPEALFERFHLGGCNRIGSGARRDDDIRVIDDAPLTGTTEEPQGIGQEDLALEACEPGVVLNKQHSRMTEDQRGTLTASLRLAELHVVRRCVELHLLSRPKFIPTRRGFGRFAKPVPGHEPCQCAVFHLDPVLGQFLPNSDEIALASNHLGPNSLQVRLQCPLGSHGWNLGRPLLENRHHAPA